MSCGGHSAPQRAGAWCMAFCRRFPLGVRKATALGRHLISRDETMTGGLFSPWPERSLAWGCLFSVQKLTSLNSEMILECHRMSVQFLGPWINAHSTSQNNPPISGHCGLTCLWARARLEEESCAASLNNISKLAARGSVQQVALAGLHLTFD